MGDTVLETHGLSRRFGRRVAVDELDLAVPRGSVFAFLGPNGAGKTTTIRMALGLIRSSSGEVRLLGEPMPRGRLRALARTGALVESPSLYPHLSGRENLEATRRMLRVDRGRIDACLRLVGLQDDAKRLVKRYSLGMKQRLGLALALLGEPELLVLDEPTNGLDPGGIREMRELIRRLPAESGVTVFLSSHLLPEVEQTATHLAVVHKGRLRFQGTIEDLRARRAARLEVVVDNAARAAAALDARGIACEATGSRVLIAVAETEAARVNALLVGAGVGVSRLAMEAATLEAMFFEMTGGEEGAS
jgi:ABC-2 type transport system ATP-binding protein